VEKHGVYTTEIPTSLPPQSVQQITLPVVFGTAPVNLTDTAPVNEPILCSSFDEAASKLGYSDNWTDYTLCEHMHAHFRLYRLGPVVFVNVLDPALHKATVPPEVKSVSSGVITIQQEGILRDSVIVMSEDGTETYEAGTDYTLGYNAKGELVITVRSSGSIPSGVSTLQVGYDVLSPSSVMSADLIGGIDSMSGQATGLELLNEVFPRFGLIPSLVLAPGFAQDPVVAAVLAAKASTVNGNFEAHAVVNLNVEEIEKYQDAPTWKNQNDLTSPMQFVGYPYVTRGGKRFWFSTHLACGMVRTDLANEGIPYYSVSNQPLLIDGVEQKNGAPLYLGQDQANFLNSQGIVTALRFPDWRAWGNRTAAYPADVDPVNSFIPIRRMMSWIKNQIILRTWSKVDNPLNVRLVEAVTDEHNAWLNGLQSVGALLGGRVEFLEADNPNDSLMNGRIVFRVYVAPPPPAQEIHFMVEYDAQYLSAVIPTAE